MTTLGKAVFTLETDNSKFNEGIDRSEARTKGFGKAAAVAAGVVAGAFVGALSDAARAAAEEEVGIQRLAGAVDNAGGSWDRDAERIEAVISKREQLSFSDGELRDSLTDLTIATGSVDEAMQRQALAMDLARAKNISLEAASKLMGKVTDENVNVFARMGITVQKGADASELFASVQSKTAGASERYANTTQGGIDRIKNSIDNFKESIGGMLGPAQGLIATLPGLHSGFLLVSGTLGPAVVDLWKGRDAIIKKLAVMNPITLATKAWGIAQSVLNAVMSANPIALVVLALAGLAIAIKFAYEHFEGFRKVVDGVLAFLKGIFAPFLGILGGAFEALGKLLGGESAKAADEVTFNFDEMKSGASSSMETTRSNVTSSAKGMRDDVVEAFDVMKRKGVGATEDMEIETMLRAMGMKDGVLEQAALMATGFAGWSEQARDKAIFDMQYAKLETTLRAKGLADDVVAAILSMTVRSREQTEAMRADLSEKVDRMRERNLALRDSIDALPDYKSITIHTSYTSGGGGGGSVLASAAGFSGMVQTPTLFLAGEAGPEHVEITPQTQSVGAAVASAAVDRPILVQCHHSLEVGGREVAFAVAEHENNQSRRYGFG